MKSVRHIAYRCLTPSDYFNIYKEPGTTIGGGGQLYIDFPTASITIREWQTFFQGVNGLRESRVANGPRWKCPVHSIGVPGEEAEVTIYQRRPQTACISNQNMYSGGGERLPAWAPEHGFPAPPGAVIRALTPPANLTVFLVRTFDDEIWAGWFDANNTRLLSETIGSATFLQDMLDPRNAHGKASR
jgi:5-methylcytosine-specific restriction protein A